MDMSKPSLSGLSQEKLRELIVDASSPAPPFVKDLVLNEIKFVNSAPSLSGGRVSIDVVDLDMHLVRYWHNNIQPLINQDETRADKGWDWRTITFGTNLMGTMLLQQPAGLAIVVNLEPEFKATIPVAMLQLVCNYPHFTNLRQQSTFVWYLAGAPPEVLQQLKAPGTDNLLFTDDKIPKGLGSFALDTSLIHAFLEENEGRLGLHADAKGGRGLIDWYHKKGMINIPATESLPKGYRKWFKGNDGRYFCYNLEEALEAAKTADEFR